MKLTWVRLFGDGVELPAGQVLEHKNDLKKAIFDQI
jgi:hypothetical protein